jgi:hypothetical protein
MIESLVGGGDVFRSRFMSSTLNRITLFGGMIRRRTADAKFLDIFRMIPEKFFTL